MRRHVIGGKKKREQGRLGSLKAPEGKGKERKNRRDWEEKISKEHTEK